MIDDLRLLTPNLHDVLKSAEELAKAERHLPALILVYAGIDAIASLDRHERETAKASFLRWVSRYLLPETTFQCTSLDLYGARCGVLHTFSTRSSLSDRGEACPVVYAWHPANPEDLRRVIVRVNYKAHVLPFTELVEGVKLGLLTFFEELEADDERRSRVLASARSWLTELTAADLNAFINDQSSPPT